MDLPSPQDPRDILDIHLGKRWMDAAQFGLQALSAATRASRASRSSRRGYCPCTPRMAWGAGYPKPAWWQLKFKRERLP